MIVHLIKIIFPKTTFIDVCCLFFSVRIFHEKKSIEIKHFFVTRKTCPRLTPKMAPTSY